MAIIEPRKDYNITKLEKNQLEKNKQILMAIIEPLYNRVCDKLYSRIGDQFSINKDGGKSYRMWVFPCYVFKSWLVYRLSLDITFSTE